MVPNGNDEDDDPKHFGDPVSAMSTLSKSFAAAGHGAAIPHEHNIVHVHKVSLPPSTSLGKSCFDAVKEALFPDDPFRQFKHQPWRSRLKLGLKYALPILDWGPTYNFRKMLLGDFIAGLTITSLSVPQDLGNAKLAGLPPVYGLYSSFVPPLVYSVLGSSRDLAIGPVAVVSILLGSLLKAEFDPVTEHELYVRLAVTATFFAGVFQATLGLLRLGFIIDFLSHAAIVGFMAGAAITIGLQQLKGLLGVQHFTKKTDFVSVMRSCFQHTDQWNWQTIVIGLVFLAALLSTRILAKRKKKLFWVAAITPILSVFFSTLFVFLTRMDRHGIDIVGQIKKGINPPSLHQLDFSQAMATKAVKIGLVASLIALTEGIAIGRTFASLKDYHIDGNKEMIAFGMMNMCGSLTSCYIATGSFSRSSVNYNSGVHTMVSNILMAALVMVVLLALTPLFHYTPDCILSVIIISAVVGLIDIKAAYLIWKIDKLDFMACLGAFYGVFFVSVEVGLLVAVGMSFFKILLDVTRPDTSILGNIPGTRVYRNVTQYPDAKQMPGILVLRIGAALYFSNSNYIRTRILRYVDDEEDSLKSSTDNGIPLRYLVLELSPVMNIDTTGIQAFEELERSLRRRKLQLALANPGPAVIEKLHKSGFVTQLGSEWLFLTVQDAVQVKHLKANCGSYSCKKGLQVHYEQVPSNVRNINWWSSYDYLKAGTVIFLTRGDALGLARPNCRPCRYLT